LDSAPPVVPEPTGGWRRIDLANATVRVVCRDRDGPRGSHMRALMKELALPFGFSRHIQTLADGRAPPKYLDLAMSMLRVLWENGDRLPLLLLEDDVDAVAGFSPEMRVPADADLVYLGVSQWGYVPGAAPTGLLGATLARPWRPGFLRVYNMLSMHAVLFLSARGVRTAIGACLDAVYAGAPQDRVLASRQPGMVALALREPVFFQADRLQGGTQRRFLEQERNTRVSLPVPAHAPAMRATVNGETRHFLLAHDAGGHPAWRPAPALPGDAGSVLEIAAAVDEAASGVRCRARILTTDGAGGGG
jgi:hypothetical protein